MRKICFANLLLLLILGNLILLPRKSVTIDESVNVAYQSVCQIASTDNTYASGVLLESGYVVTAAHVVDKNQDGIIQEHEKTVELIFPEIQFKTLAKTIHGGNMNSEMDVAILKPEKPIPLPGIKMIKTIDYRKLKVGSKLYIIGMQSGLERANITDGRLITKEIDKIKHRSSANSYNGNSGGGVFVDNKLVGISSQIGLGRYMLRMPVYAVDHERHMILRITNVNVPYSFPMANQSIHVSAPSVREFVISGEYESNPLEENPAKCPYDDYMDMMFFNVLMALTTVLSVLVLKKLKF